MLVDVMRDKDLKFDILFMVLAIFCININRPYLNSLMLLFIVKQSGTLQVNSTSHASYISYVFSCTFRMWSKLSLYRFSLWQ